MAETADLFMTAGDTKTLGISVIEKDDGSATTITGATINWKVSRSPRQTAVISKSTADDISITSGTGGTLTISLSASDTSSLLGDFYHELQITFASGEVATVLRGKMTIEPGLN